MISNINSRQSIFFSRTMALELGPYNIRVNTVNPTVIMTEMGKLGWTEPEKANTMLSKIPLGRFGGKYSVDSANQIFANYIL